MNVAPYSDDMYEGKEEIFGNCPSGITVLVLLAQPIQTNLIVEIILNSEPNDTTDQMQSLLKTILSSLKIDNTKFSK